MNYRMIFKMVGIIALVEAGLLIIPLIIGLALGENTVLAFIVTILSLIAFGILLILQKPESKKIYAKEGFIIVALSWIIVAVFGALPFYISGAIPHFIDSLFETVSGFTTTGATILSNVEIIPKSLLFWRSFTHWIGGMGVLVLVIAILPQADAKTYYIFRAESPGPQVGKLVSKMRFTARILYGIYIALTAIEFILLLIGGMPVFDSLIHAFGTAGTGGFSNRNYSVGAYNNLYFEIVITVFMFIFSINFNLFYLILIKKFRQAIKSEEFRGLCVITTVSIILVTASLLVNSVYKTFGEALRYSSFQVISILSTTGYSTADFTTWPMTTQIILVILMFIGGSAGSTAGGLKISRVSILAKSCVSELKRAISPRTVYNIKYDDKPVDNALSNSIKGYFALYSIIIAFSILIISITDGSLPNDSGFVKIVTSVITCINNVGPGLGIIGPLGNFQSFSITAKLILVFDMLIGRLEIFSILLLFYPKTWIKR